MRKVFVEHKFFKTEESPEKDFEYSYPESVCWGTYPEDEPKEGDWFLYVDIESYNKLQEENKLLREAVEAIYNIDAKYIDTDYEYRYDMFYNDMSEIVEDTLAKIKGNENG